MKNLRFLLLLSLVLSVLSSYHFGIERNFDKLRSKRSLHVIDKDVSNKIKLPSKYEVTVDGGNTDGLYYILIGLGTPQQLQYVQLDTGSADLAIPSIYCEDFCSNHTDASYDPTTSTTSHLISCSEGPSIGLICPNSKCINNTSCGYKLTYLDQSSITAVIYSDQLSISDDIQINQVFGAIVNETIVYVPFEPVSVDGIMGIGYKSISHANAPTLIDNLVDQLGMDNLFAICILDDGGELYLGEIPSFVSIDSIDWIPIEVEDYYSISVVDLLINSKSIEISPYYFNSPTGSGSAVDSGSTELLLPVTVYNKFVSDVFSLCSVKSNSWKGICDVDPNESLFAGFCYDIDESKISEYPIFSLVLNGGAIIDISPASWLIKGLCLDPDQYAVAIDSVDNRYGTILGDTFMKNRISIFDRANKQIGFSSVTRCH